MQNYLLNTPNTSTTVEGQLLNLTANTSNKTNPQKAGKNFNEIFQSTTNKQNDLMKKIDPRKEQGQSSAQNTAQADNKTDNKTARNTQNANSQSGANNAQDANNAQAPLKGQKQSSQDTLQSQSSDAVADNSAVLNKASLESSLLSVEQGDTVDTEADFVVQNQLQNQDLTAKNPQLLSKDVNVDIQKELPVGTVLNNVQKTVDTSDLDSVIEIAAPEEVINLAEDIDELVKISGEVLTEDVKSQLQELKELLDKLTQEEVDVPKEDINAAKDLLASSSSKPEELTGDKLEELIEDLKKVAAVQNNTTDTSVVSGAAESTAIAGAAASLQTQNQDILKNPGSNASLNDLSVSADIKNQDKLFADSRNVSVQTNIEKGTGEVNVQKQIAEQKILNDINLNIEKISVESSGAKSVPPSKASVSASEQVVKMSIESAEKAAAKTASDPAQITTQQGAKTANTQNTSAPQLASAPKELNKNDLLNQIGAKFEQIKSGMNSKITMTLRPVELGRLTIEISQGSKGVAATFVAQNQQVKELLEKNLEALRQQLAGSGVNVQNINVKVAAETSTNFSNSSFSQNDDGSDESRENLGRDTSDENPQEGRGEEKKNGSEQERKNK